MQWNLTSILFLIGAWLVGYAIGLIEMHLRQSRKIKHLEEELQRKETAPLESLSSPGNDVLRVWLDEQESLHLELDGSTLSAPGQITASQRKRLIEVLNRLRPWLEGQAPPRPTVSSPPAAAIRPATPAPVSYPEQPFVKGPPASLPRASEVSPSATNIIEQIDEILQRRLSGTPLAGRVRLREQAGGGIEIWVNAKRYTSVDEIAEADAKAAIRAAIAEWEAHS